MFDIKVIEGWPDDQILLVSPVGDNKFDCILIKGIG